MTTIYTTAAQLDSLPTGTLITPTKGSYIDTAYHTHMGYYLLIGSGTHWTANALLAIHAAWLPVPEPRPYRPSCPRCLGTGYVTNTEWQTVRCNLCGIIPARRSA